MEWIQKERTYNKSKFDGEVIVSLIKRGKAINTCFKFRKNSFHKIVKEGGECIVLARDGSRIYFREEPSNLGFKLRTCGENSRFVYIPKKLVSETEVGEYNLKFDRDAMLCYIDIDCKLEKELTWFGKE